MRQPDPGAHRRGQRGQQFLKAKGLRPGGVGNGILGLHSLPPPLGRQVFGMDGLNLAVAIPRRR